MLETLIGETGQSRLPCFGLVTFHFRLIERKRMISPTYVNYDVLQKFSSCLPRDAEENPYVIMTSSNQGKRPEILYDTLPSEMTADYESIGQRRRHTHDSVFRRTRKDFDELGGLDEDPFYETIRWDNTEQLEELYVSMDELKEGLNEIEIGQQKKLYKVCERKPTRMKLKRPISISFPTSSLHHQDNNSNSTTCDEQWIEVLRQKSQDEESDRCLQHIHRTSRRRTANILRATRSNDVINNIEIINNNTKIDNKNNNNSDNKNTKNNNHNNNINNDNNNNNNTVCNKENNVSAIVPQEPNTNNNNIDYGNTNIISLTSDLLRSQLSFENHQTTAFTKERKNTSSEELRNMCFGPMLV